jgi:Tfp pilus assembly protein PilX
MTHRNEYLRGRRDGGVALVIVLAFVVLLTLTVVAYL